MLVAIAALGVARGPLLIGVDHFAGRAAGQLKGTLRADLTAHMFALGPAWTSRERSGELAGVIGGGLDSLDAYVTSYQPARALAVAVPLLVLGAVFLVDPPTTLVLLFTGPILVLLLAIIGGRTRAITERRFARGPLPGCLLPRHAPRPADVEDVRAWPGAGGEHPRHQPAVRRDDDGRAPNGLPDLARPRMGRRSRRGAGGGRGQPAADGRRDRVRARAGGPDHRPRVLPPAAHARHALSLGGGRPDGRREGLRGPRRAGAGRRGGRRGRRASRRVRASRSLPRPISRSPA